MGAWQGLGKFRIGVGILVNIGWWGVPKNVGPRDRSKWKSAMLAEEISVWRPQKTIFLVKKHVCLVDFLVIFHYLGVPLGAHHPSLRSSVYKAHWQRGNMPDPAILQ